MKLFAHHSEFYTKMEQFESTLELMSKSRKICPFCPITIEKNSKRRTVRKRKRTQRQCVCKTFICKSHAFSICKLCINMIKNNPNFTSNPETLEKVSAKARICKYADCKLKTRMFCTFCEQNFCAVHLSFVCPPCAQQQ